MEIGGGSRVGGGVKLEQHNLRDLLRMKEEDHRNNLNRSSGSSHGDGGGSSGLTLLALFNEKCEPLPAVEEPLRGGSDSSRTLYDIIREDRMSGFGGGPSDGGRSWRQLRDRIRGRQGGRVPSWSSAVPVPDPDSQFNHQHRNRAAVTRRLSDRLDSISNSAESIQPVTPSHVQDSTNSISRRNPSRETETASGRFHQPATARANNSTSLPEDRPHQEESTERGGNAAAVETAIESRGAEPQPARMSLMALLTENDRQMGLKRSAYVMYEYSKNGPAEDEDRGENNCCVCMVRQKGAAFIPCGHTFCRQCSRELWVQRGNCPICNNCILEILDIF